MIKAFFALIAFNSKNDGLFILFTDATSGVTTQAANRSLAVPAPVEDGTVLDFTRAANLPCAFTEPLPPAGSNLPFAVKAGEKRSQERQG